MKTLQGFFYVEVKPKLMVLIASLKLLFWALLKVFFNIATGNSALVMEKKCVQLY